MARKKEAQATNATPASEAMTLATAETSEAEKALELVRRIKISTPEQLQFAVAATAEIKEKWEAIDAKRRKILQHFKDGIKEVDSLLKPPLEFYEKAEQVLKAEIERHHDAGIQRRGLLLAAAGEAAQEGRAEEAAALVAEAEGAIPQKIDGLSMRTRWTGSVTDPKKLPPEYLTPDVAALLAVTAAKGCDPGIPGWEAKPISNSAITASKVAR